MALDSDPNGDKLLRPMFGLSNGEPFSLAQPNVNAINVTAAIVMKWFFIPISVCRMVAMHGDFSES